MSTLLERSNAQLTFVRPQPQMAIIHVSPQAVGKGERLCTNGATMRSSATMSSDHMFVEVASFCKRPIAVCACVWFGLYRVQQEPD